MNIYELAKACVDAINQDAAARDSKLPKLPSHPCIVLKMPPAAGEPKRRKLYSHGHSPMGIVLDRQTDWDIVLFKAIDVLAFCVARSGGAIALETSSSMIRVLKKAEKYDHE